MLKVILLYTLDSELPSSWMIPHAVRIACFHVHGVISLTMGSDNGINYQVFLCFKRDFFVDLSVTQSVAVGKACSNQSALKVEKCSYCAI